MQDDTTEQKPTIKMPEEPSTEVQLGTAPVVNYAGKDASDDSAQAPGAAQVEITEPAATSQQALASETDTAETDAAVDDIMREESDVLLATADTALPPDPTAKKPNLWRKLWSLLQLWWYNKWARYGTLGGLLLVFLLVFAVPPSRYFVLNTVGVRASASVTIVDAETDLPLKNVVVQLGGAEAKTDESGQASLEQVRLGSQDIVVERVAFAQLRQQVTVGWGSNPFGTLELTPSGLTYHIQVEDYLSGTAITTAEATSGEANALADEHGEIQLVLEDPDTAYIEITITADGYRSDTIALEIDSTEDMIAKLVPDQSVFYISKQSGKYDLYRMDIDGKNKKVLLTGSGNETTDIRLVASPDGKYVALSSVRSSARDSGGYPLKTLTLLDVTSGATTAIDQAQSISFVAWQGDYLVYQATYAAPSAATQQRQRLLAYAVSEKARSTLVTTDYFSGFFASGNFIYYAISPSDPSGATGFYRIKMDGSGKQTLLEQSIWGMVRVNETQLSIETPDGWYSYTIGGEKPSKGTSPANVYSSHAYVTNQATGQSLWIDERDGKQVVLLHDPTGEKDDSAIVTASGITEPLRWLNDTTFVYRVQTNTETAEYAASTLGGEPIKLVDVTAVSGFSATTY